MAIDDIYLESLSLEHLLQHKRLEPLAPASIARLEEVQKLDVTGFTEAEVRHSIIDPMVSILGYKKGTDFSLGLERKVSVVGENLFPDYRFLLWEHDFWLIEAKNPIAAKPKTARGKKKTLTPPVSSFGPKAVRQAVEYASHPRINAALVLICDGRNMELFDREVSLDEPLVKIEIRHLVKEFDKLRAFLEPWQAWFFQKRRVVRLLDKVFDKEFNLGRLEELKSLVQRRIDRKRATVVRNMQAMAAKLDHDATARFLQSADPVTLVNGCFFLQFSHSETHAMLEALLSHCGHDTFRVLHLLFPDEVRDANHAYWPHALAFLIRLEAQRKQVNWLPAWLAPRPGPEIPLRPAIERLIQHCLTQFRDDPARRTVLLAASGLRRTLKALSVVWGGAQELAETRHALERFIAPELSIRQIRSSPSRQALIALDEQVLFSLARLVAEWQDENRAFNVESAKTKLRTLWQMERRIVESVTDYRALLKEKAFGEMHSTEFVDVSYDFLGHFTLCLLDGLPEWKSYALAKHRTDIETIARFGSWQAKEWLGYKKDEKLGSILVSQLADRFFFGDEQITRALHGVYSGDKTAP